MIRNEANISDAFYAWLSNPSNWIGVFEYQGFGDDQPGIRVALYFDIKTWDYAHVDTTRMPDYNKRMGLGWRFVLIGKFNVVEEDKDSYTFKASFRRTLDDALRCLKGPDDTPLYCDHETFIDTILPAPCNHLFEDDDLIGTYRTDFGVSIIQYRCPHCGKEGAWPKGWYGPRRCGGTVNVSY